MVFRFGWKQNHNFRSLHRLICIKLPLDLKKNKVQPIKNEE